MAAATHEEPILSRLDRLDNIVRRLEEMRNESRSGKSSCASTLSSGTLTSEGHARSSFDFSPKSLEKHCRPIHHVITETELKGTLIQRLHHVEQRVLKLGLELEREAEAEKKQDDDEMHTPQPDSHEKRRKKKGLKQFMKSVISASKLKSKLAC